MTDWTRHPDGSCTMTDGRTEWTVRRSRLRPGRWNVFVRDLAAGVQGIDPVAYPSCRAAKEAAEAAARRRSP